MCVSAFFHIRTSRGSRAFHCLQSRYTGRKRRGGGRSSASLSSEDEGRSEAAAAIDKLRLSGLEGTFVGGIAISGFFGDTLIEVMRVGGVRKKTDFDDRAELVDKSVFLFFVGVSGSMVVVSKAACTWVYTLKKSLGFKQAAA